MPKADDDIALLKEQITVLQEAVYPLIPVDGIRGIVCLPVEGEQVLVALTRGGKLFARMQDQRSFAQGPNHRRQYNWVPIEGPPDV